MARIQKLFAQEKKLYFLHIPKTAGTSISKVLHQIAAEKGLEMLGPVLLDHLIDKPNWKEANIVAGHLGLLPVGQNFQYFTVLRDPLERVYSYYLHVKRDANHYFNKIVGGENLDFLNYLLDVRFYNLNFNMQTRYLSTMPKIGNFDKVGVLTPKAYEFGNSPGSEINLKLALRTLEKALWVGDINNLSQLGQFLEKEFDVPDIAFPSLNVDPSDRKKFSSGPARNLLDTLG